MTSFHHVMIIGVTFFSSDDSAILFQASRSAVQSGKTRCGDAKP